MAPTTSSGVHSLQAQSSQAEFESALEQIRCRSGSEAPRDLQSWVDATLGSGLSIVAVRPLLDAFATTLKGLPTAGQISAGRHSVDALRSKVASYEEQDSLLRHILAEAYTANEEWVEAAKVLQGLQLESSQRKVSDIDKFNIWVRICRLYLEDNDTITAESYLNRAKNLLYQIDDKQAQLFFKLSQARILDSQRRFLEAATVYHDISAAPLLADDERDHTLSKGIACAVLAPAGAQRTALLRKLHRDERAQHLNEFAMLENMYLGRLIAPQEVDRFASKLADHQLATTADGTTVLAKAVIEHNLLGISGLYDSINAVELGLLLGLAPAKAEEYTARMVEQGRLDARIDHVYGYISFSPDRGGSKFDERIKLLLEDVERVSGLVNVKA